MIDFDIVSSSIDRVVKELENPFQPIYDFDPVSVRVFVESPLYLNLNDSVDSAGKLYPVWMDELIELFGEEYQLELPYDQVVYIAPSGTGKSFVTSIIISYLLYRDLIVRNFRRFVGIAENSLLAFLNTSVTATQAKNILFGEISNRIGSSYWFQKYFRRSPDKESVIEIQKFDDGKWRDTRFLIFPGSSSEKVPIGYNIRGGVVDEVDYYQYTIESQRKGIREWDAAQEVWDNFYNRFNSRGNENFQKTSFLCAITTSRYEDSFAERKEVESQQNKKIRFRRFGLTDIKKINSSVFFYLDLKSQKIVKESQLVDLGRSDFSSDKILEKAREFGFFGNGIRDAVQFIFDFQSRLRRVPDIYLERFERDFNKAVRDILSLPVSAISPLFVNKQLVWDNCNVERENPVSPDGQFKSWFVGERGVDYYGHLDLAENNCGVGLAIGHWDRVKNLVILDLILQVVSNYQDVKFPGETLLLKVGGNEIDVEAVENLILSVSKKGFYLKLMTTDQFQSLHSRQRLQSNGINTEKKSVIRDKVNFLNVKDLILRRQLDYYLHRPFIEEVVSAELVKDKVVPGAGKKIDVFEAVAGCVRNILESLGSGVTDLPTPLLGSRGLVHRFDTSSREDRRFVLEREKTVDELSNYSSNKVGVRRLPSAVYFSRRVWGR